MPSERNNKQKKLLILCPHPLGYVPGQRLKYEQYLEIFKTNGYQVRVSPFMSEAFQKIVYTKGHYLSKLFWTLFGYARRIYDLFSLPCYDIVYVFLWVTPFGPPLFERLTSKLSHKLIYDIDDMIYLQDHRSKTNPIISKIKGKNKPVYLFRAANYVITSTETIEEFAKKINDKVVNIPVTINTSAYTPKISYVKQKEKIIIGWSGSYTTSPYLHLLDDVLLQVRRKYDFTLLVMGDENFRIPGIDVKAIPWQEGYEIATIRSFDIGLYPLPNDEWVLGKGGGKALQYMAVGVPTIATGVGVNFKIIDNGENGFLVSSQEEWVDRICQLIADESLREKMGTKGTETIEKYYSVNANKDKYLSILNILSAS